jgi:pimeloyl-ACP methyl ester carboxylesterase
MMKILFYGLIVLGCLYFTLLACIYIFQSRLIFQAIPLPQDYIFDFNAPFEEHTITTKDGAELNALLFSTEQERKGVILYFHGNRGNLNRWGQYHTAFTEKGYDFFIFDYRGYGKSSGSPSEKGVYTDAEAAYQWLTQHYSSSDIIFYGRSLGSGVATYLALHQPGKVLVLETPYDNMPNVFRSKALLPIPSFLFKHQFATDERLGQVEIPVYIFVGGEDRLIPPTRSRQLLPLIDHPSHFSVIEGAGHRNLSDFAEYHFLLKKWLK